MDPATIGGIRITRIGNFTARDARAAITAVDENGRRRKLAAGGWEHRFG